MKNTGVIKRIDTMGRVVIPKEIRKNFRINTGDNVELYIEGDNKIILKKHSLLKKIDDFAQNYVNSIYNITKHNIIITDTKDVIAGAGSLKKEYLNKPISINLEYAISRRQNILEKYTKEFEFIEDKKENGTYSISSIVVQGDVVGLVIMFSQEENIKEFEEKIVKIAAEFLGKYLE